MEQVRSSLEQTEKGKVSNAAANYKRVFQLDPLLKGAIRKNLLTERVDIVKPLGWYRDSPTLTDVDIKYLLLYFEENYGLTIEKKIQDAVMVIANENRYHPVRDFLNALQWDGTERIRYCLHRFLGADANDYTYEAMRLFLLGAISRAFRPGCKFEIMLCLVGGQGAGKSSFFRLLAVQDDWFSDDLKKLDDENVYRKMQGHWLIEMSEMIATANAKSIEEIKSFLSRQKETYKVPYETHPADRKRQCVFCGTSNTLDFLPLDRTGNRRFVPVMVHPELAEIHILDDEPAARAYLIQVWAEAMEIYRSGNFKLRFSPAMNEYLKVHQRDFMPEDTKAGQIIEYASEAREDDPEFQSPVDLMFERLEQKDPDHFAVRQYKKFLLSAGKTRSSILISCGARLAPFDIREVRELMEDDEMELDTIGDEKTVLFLIMSDTDTTFNFILAMLQSQLINLLCDRADDKYGGRLPVHVRLILDEFANIGQIPNFDKLIATIRSREISASIILQSQSQLKAIYKDAAEIISDNCDSVLFLSGRGKNAKEISDALGKETIDSFNTSETRGSQTSHGLNYQKLGKALMSEDEIAIMDGGRCILQLRGVRPFFSEKFDITKHPHYKYLADADKKNTFDVDRFLSTLRRKRQQVVAQDEPFDLYEIDLSDEDAAAE